MTFLKIVAKIRVVYPWYIPSSMAVKSLPISQNSSAICRLYWCEVVILTSRSGGVQKLQPTKNNRFVGLVAFPHVHSLFIFWGRMTILFDSPWRAANITAVGSNANHPSSDRNLIPQKGYTTGTVSKQSLLKEGVTLESANKINPWLIETLGSHETTRFFKDCTNTCFSRVFEVDYIYSLLVYGRIRGFDFKFDSKNE